MRIAIPHAATAAFVLIAVVSTGAWVLSQHQSFGPGARAEARSRTLTAAFFDSAATSRREKASHRRDVARELGSVLRLHTMLRK